MGPEEQKWSVRRTVLPLLWRDELVVVGASTPPRAQEYLVIEKRIGY